MRRRFWGIAGITGALLVLGLVSGCGHSDSGDSNASPDGTYTVEFDDNGCKTGKHVFNGFDNYCHGLEDDSLNRGCALSERQEAFVVGHCPGNFQSA
jgi:hypothetical protein